MILYVQNSLAFNFEPEAEKRPRSAEFALAVWKPQRRHPHDSVIKVNSAAMAVLQLPPSNTPLRNHSCTHCSNKHLAFPPCRHLFQSSGCLVPYYRNTLDLLGLQSNHCYHNARAGIAHIRPWALRVQIRGKKLL